MKLLAAVTLFVFSLSAQVPNVAISKEPPNEAVTTLTFYDANGVPQYICKAFSRQPLFTWAVTATASTGTLTSIAVATNVGTVTTAANGTYPANHGLLPGSLVNVTGSATTALNGLYIVQTAPSGTTFTITTSGVADGTYNDSTLKVASTAPRSSFAMWSVERFTNTGPGNSPVRDQWATALAAGSGGSTARTFVCDSRATLAYQ